MDYMTRAANAGDVTSVLYLARAYDTGLNLGVERKVKKADLFYENKDENVHGYEVRGKKV